MLNLKETLIVVFMAAVFSTVFTQLALQYYTAKKDELDAANFWATHEKNQAEIRAEFCRTYVRWRTSEYGEPTSLDKTCPIGPQ